MSRAVFLTPNLNSVRSVARSSVVRSPVGLLVGGNRGGTVGWVLADDQQRLGGPFGPSQAAVRLGGAEHFLQQRRVRLPARSIQSVDVVRDGHLQVRVDLRPEGLDVLQTVGQVSDGLGLGQVLLAGHQLVRLRHGEGGAGREQVLLLLLVGVVAGPQRGKQRTGGVQQVEVSREEPSLSRLGMPAEQRENISKVGLSFYISFLTFNLTNITNLLKVKRFVIHYNIGRDSNHYR